MKILRTFLLLILLSQSALLTLAQASEFNPSQAFLRAGEFYKNGDYSKAVEVYESIRAKGLENGALYYNLGNSYVKDGQVGKAMLNYERARKFMPRDSDLKANERYVRSLIKYYSPPVKQRFWQRWFSRYLNYWTLDELTWIVLGFVILVATVHLLGLYCKWERRNSFLGVLVLSVGLLIHVFVFTIKFQNLQDRAVALKEVKATFEPVDEATVHFNLGEGEKVKILKQQDDWLKIQRLDEKVGWIDRSKLERI